MPCQALILGLNEVVRGSLAAFEPAYQPPKSKADATLVTISRERNHDGENQPSHVSRPHNATSVWRQRRACMPLAQQGDHSRRARTRNWCLASWAFAAAATAWELLFAGRPDCEVAYLADVDTSLFGTSASAGYSRFVDPSLRGPRVESFRKIQGTAPKTVQDFRRVLDYPSVDAIVVAYARPLACAGDDLGMPGRQTRLRRKTRQPFALGRAQDGRSSQEIPPSCPIGNPEPQRSVYDRSQEVHR